MKLKIFKLSILILSTVILASCSSNKQVEDNKTITVGATPSPHAEILKEASRLLKAKGYNLKVVEFVDYVQPNIALQNGELDANYFQHEPYLQEFNKQNNLELVSVANIHYEPFGIYSNKINSINDLEQNIQISVPNDTTNEARALLLLEQQGIIKLKEGIGIDATKNDILENPKNVVIKEIDAAQLPISLPDVDLAVINGNYAIGANLDVNKDALAIEDKNSISANVYSNIIAAKKGNENNDKIKILVDILKSNEIKNFIEQKYKGAVVPI